MSFSVTEPSSRQKWFAGILVIGYAVITLLPLFWIIATGFKSAPDSIAYPPKVMFDPTVEGYVNLFTTQTRMPTDLIAEARANPGHDLMRECNLGNQYECLSPGLECFGDCTQIDFGLAAARDAME